MKPFHHIFLYFSILHRYWGRKLLDISKHEWKYKRQLLIGIHYCHSIFIAFFKTLVHYFINKRRFEKLMRFISIIDISFLFVFFDKSACQNRRFAKIAIGLPLNCSWRLKIINDLICTFRMWCDFEISMGDEVHSIPVILPIVSRLCTNITVIWTNGSLHGDPKRSYIYKSLDLQWNGHVMSKFKVDCALLKLDVSCWTLKKWIFASDVQ